jgi:antagonist of KipI
MIRVETAGLLTTVQDEGRWGYQAYGVPVAGAMDRYAYRVANLLVGNTAGAATLEMTISGGSLIFDSAAYVAIAGADMQATLNDVPVANWSAFPVPAGSVLAFGYAASGCRAYLAVSGGIDVPEVLGSRSTYTRAGIGGLNGRKLQAGDRLNLGLSAVAGPALTLPAQYQRIYPREVALRVMTGPQDDLFTAEGLATLFAAAYQITDEADRMGYRLEGAAIAHTGKADIVSDALPQGAIQIPGHGRPIIMMADRQTTGGYTKIGTVIGPDLAVLAQAKPGDTVRFLHSTDEEAVEVLRAERESYAAIASWRDSALRRPAAVVQRFSISVNGQTYAVEIKEV